MIRLRISSGFSSLLGLWCWPSTWASRHKQQPLATLPRELQRNLGLWIETWNQNQDHPAFGCLWWGPRGGGRGVWIIFVSPPVQQFKDLTLPNLIRTEGSMTLFSCRSLNGGSSESNLQEGSLYSSGCVYERCGEDWSSAYLGHVAPERNRYWDTRQSSHPIMVMITWASKKCHWITQWDHKHLILTKPQTTRNGLADFFLPENLENRTLEV